MIADESAPPPSSEPASRQLLARNLAALGGSQVTTWITSVVPVLLIPKALGASAMGTYTAALSVAAIFALLGSIVSSDYLVIEMVSKPSIAARLASGALLTRVLTTLPFGAAIFLYVRMAGINHSQALIFYFVAAAAAFGMALDTVQASLRSIQRMDYIAASGIAVAIASDIIAILIIVVGGGAFGLSWATAAVALAVLVANILLALRLGTFAWRVDFRQLRSLVTGALPYWPKQFALVFYIYIDTVLLSLMQHPQVVGWYGLGTRVLSTILFIPTIASAAWYPRLISAHQVSDEALQRESSPFLRLVFRSSIPISVATVVSAGPLIHMLYGSQYTSAVSVAIVLGLCAIPMSMGICYGYLLTAIRRPMAVTAVLLVGIVVNVGLNVVLIPLFAHRYSNGALGAAVSLLATEVVITSGMAIQLGRRFLRRDAFHRVPSAAAASAAMYVVARLSARLGLDSLVLSGLTFVVVAIALGVVTRDERRQLVNLARSSFRSKDHNSPVVAP